MSIRDEARREYVRRAVGPSVGTIGDRLSAAWDAGASWERDRDPSDAEVEASAQELWKHRALGTVHPNYPWDGLAPELRQSLRELARTALSAARAARRDEEKR